MSPFAALKHRLVDYLWLRALKRDQSRLGRVAAPRYTRYLRKCQRVFAGPPPAPEALVRARSFQAQGFAAFSSPALTAIAASISNRLAAEERAGLPIWDGDGRYARADIATTFPELEALFLGEVADFIRAVYRAEFKIFFGVLYKSERLADAAAGSQLWHADGGPGTCINLMFYLSEATAENGAMECLPWPCTLEIFSRERPALRGKQDGALSKAGQRDVRTSWYHKEIVSRHASQVVRPVGGPGLVLAFRNNILHKGGFPEPGHSRKVCVFHIYPAERPVPFSCYHDRGLGKGDAYPMDPAC